MDGEAVMPVPEDRREHHLDREPKDEGEPREDEDQSARAQANSTLGGHLRRV